MYKWIIRSSVIIFQLWILSGCNLPSAENSSTQTDLPEYLFTAAAETTEAQLNQTPSPEIKNPTITFTPTDSQVTPSQQPTATSTPSEIPTKPINSEVIFFDDFKDKSGWYTNEDDRFGFKYTEDGYHIYNNVKMGLIWSIREQEFSGVALEVDGTRLDGPDESFFGVVCKFKDDGKNYYALVIGDNGFYGLGLMENSEFEFIETGMDENEIIREGINETNRLRGVCNGDHYQIYANNKLLLDLWDSTLEEGIVGLVVGNQGTGLGSEFRFNDFAISWP